MKMQISLLVLGLVVLSGCESTLSNTRTFKVDGIPRATLVQTKNRYGDLDTKETVDIDSASSGFGGVPLGVGSHGNGPQVFILQDGAPPTAAARAMEQIPYGGIGLVPVPGQATPPQPSAKEKKLIEAVKLQQGAIEDLAESVKKLEEKK